MCIGIPGQICAIDAVLAKVEVCGIQRDVDLTLVGAVDEQGQPRLGQWAVSYTHLDVYKRQRPIPPPGRAASPTGIPVCWRPLPRAR